MFQGYNDSNKDLNFIENFIEKHRLEIQLKNNATRDTPVKNYKILDTTSPAVNLPFTASLDSSLLSDKSSSCCSQVSKEIVDSRQAILDSLKKKKCKVETIKKSSSNFDPLSILAKSLSNQLVPSDETVNGSLKSETCTVSNFMEHSGCNGYVVKSAGHNEGTLLNKTSVFCKTTEDLQKRKNRIHNLLLSLRGENDKPTSLETATLEDKVEIIDSGSSDFDIVSDDGSSCGMVIENDPTMYDSISSPECVVEEVSKNRPASVLESVSSEGTPELSDVEDGEISPVEDGEISPVSSRESALNLSSGDEKMPFRVLFTGDERTRNIVPKNWKESFECNVFISNEEQLENFCNNVDQQLKKDNIYDMVLIFAFHQQLVTKLCQTVNGQKFPFLELNDDANINNLLDIAKIYEVKWRELYPRIVILWMMPYPIDFCIYNSRVCPQMGIERWKKYTTCNEHYWNQIKKISSLWVKKMVNRNCFPTHSAMMLSAADKDAFNDGKGVIPKNCLKVGLLPNDTFTTFIGSLLLKHIEDKFPHFKPKLEVLLGAPSYPFSRNRDFSDLPSSLCSKLMKLAQVYDQYHHRPHTHPEYNKIMSTFSRGNSSRNDTEVPNPSLKYPLDSDAADHFKRYLDKDFSSAWSSEVEKFLQSCKSPSSKERDAIDRQKIPKDLPSNIASFESSSKKQVQGTTKSRYNVFDRSSPSERSVTGRDRFQDYYKKFRRESSRSSSERSRKVRKNHRDKYRRSPSRKSISRDRSTRERSSSTYNRVSSRQSSNSSRDFSRRKRHRKSRKEIYDTSYDSFDSSSERARSSSKQHKKKIKKKHRRRSKYSKRAKSERKYKRVSSSASSNSSCNTSNEEDETSDVEALLMKERAKRNEHKASEDISNNMPQLKKCKLEVLSNNESNNTSIVDTTSLKKIINAVTFKNTSNIEEISKNFDQSSPDKPLVSIKIENTEKVNLVCNAEKVKLEPNTEIVKLEPNAKKVKLEPDAGCSVSEINPTSMTSSVPKTSSNAKEVEMTMKEVRNCPSSDCDGVSVNIDEVVQNENFWSELSCLVTDEYSQNDNPQSSNDDHQPLVLNDSLTLNSNSQLHEDSNDHLQNASEHHPLKSNYDNVLVSNVDKTFVNSNNDLLGDNFDVPKVVNNETFKHHVHLIEVLSLLKNLPDYLGSLSIAVSSMHSKAVECQKTGKNPLSVLNSINRSDLKLIIDKLDSFLHSSNTQELEKTVCKIARYELNEVLKELPKQGGNFFGLDLEKIASVTAGYDTQRLLIFIRSTLSYHGISHVSKKNIMAIYMQLKALQLQKDKS